MKKAHDIYSWATEKWVIAFATFDIIKMIIILLLLLAIVVKTGLQNRNCFAILELYFQNDTCMLLRSC